MDNSFDVNKIIDFSSYGVTPEKELIFQSFSHKGWKMYWLNEKMISSTNVDKLMPLFKINRLPEMLYANNRALIINESKDIVIDFNPFDMLNFSCFKEREKYFTSKDTEQIETKIENLSLESNKSLQRVYYIPSELKVQYSEKWKNLKVDRDDIQNIEPTSDWTFSSPFMGVISNLNSHIIFLKGQNITVNPNLAIKLTSEDIPVNRYIAF